ncbi:MAG: MFS transporter [Gammaproteobacteria bacterium]|nr:MFS transporter [Gammaproteobacteria bacterium]
MKRALQHWLVMAVLSASGGIIFLLPFLQEVYYKPLMTALDVDNTQVGSLMSAFGLTSMLCYFPGGWLADRVSPRKLLTLSLLATGALGLYFATFPPYIVSLAIHTVWGVSITLLFWGAMIRVTRGWASADQQGRAFGLLETGRGLGEVLTSMLLLALFGMLGASAFGLSMVITALSFCTLGLGVLAWFVIDDDVGTPDGKTGTVGLTEVLRVLKMPVIWLIAAVILSAYCAYWGTFRFTSYATDMFGLSVSIAAAISVAKMWLKPLAAFGAGFASDRIGIARSVSILFAVLVISFGAFAVLPGQPGLIPAMLLNVAVASIAVFGLRGIYFALLEEGGVPMAVTGTAAGIISVIGYTPDIFMPLLGGLLLDRFPGEAGYRYFFFFTSGVCIIGFIAAVLIWRRVRTPSGAQDAGSARV